MRLPSILFSVNAFRNSECAMNAFISAVTFIVSTTGAAFATGITVPTNCVAADCSATEASPLPGLASFFFGKRTSFALYSFNRAMLVARDSADLLNRRRSTAMPIVGANFSGMPAPLSSSTENPRPRRTFALYLIVGQWTAGRRAPPVGRGAIFAALAWRLRRRAFFCDAWSNQVITEIGPLMVPLAPPAHFLWKCWLGTTLLCFTILKAT
mmetsp:Transcript_78905/g.157685  ORF Transcript_78905/g.157685 Transcript_78905/m.157685 type:complete len:211 (+) Transcript_78905:315-947(+)